MRSFDILKHPSGDIQAVKQGWCWPAFFFEWIWALISGLWGVLLAVIVVSFVVGFILGAAGVPGLLLLFVIIVRIVFGSNGNEWRKNKLISKGYELKGTVTATSKEIAVTLFMTNSNYNPSHSGPTPTFSSAPLSSSTTKTAQVSDKIQAKPDIDALDSIINETPRN